MFSIRSKRVAAALAATLVLGGLTACQPAPHLGPMRSGPTNTGRVSTDPVVADIVVQAGSSPATVAQAMRAPALPAVAATNDLLAVAAGNALWALWFDDPTYAEKLETVIPEVARRAGVAAAPLAAVWREAPRDRMVVVLSALTQVGVPYRRYESEVGKGFDCSGLTSWAWAQVGVMLPRVSTRQIRLAVPLTLPNVQPGDLLHFPGHIMMALGFGTAMIHAPYTGGVVEVRPMIGGKSHRLAAGSPI